MVEEKSDKTFVKSVSEIYQRLELFKRIAIGSVVSNVILGFCLSLTLFSDPIVIMETGAEKLSFNGEKREVEVTETEIKKLVENFIKRRFQWEKFSTFEVMDRLGPIVTNGLREKISNEIEKQSESYKSISQYVGKIQVEIDADGNVVGTFDKVLRITGKSQGGSDIPKLPEKIPLLSESQIMVKVVLGTRTDENPLGLYVNSVVSYEAQ